jgi:hypothetical protein
MDSKRSPARRSRTSTAACALRSTPPRIGSIRGRRQSPGAGCRILPRPRARSACTAGSTLRDRARPTATTAMCSPPRPSKPRSRRCSATGLSGIPTRIGGRWISHPTPSVAPCAWPPRHGRAAIPPSRWGDGSRPSSTGPPSSTACEPRSHRSAASASLSPAPTCTCDACATAWPCWMRPRTDPPS